MEEVQSSVSVAEASSLSLAEPGEKREGSEWVRKLLSLFPSLYVGVGALRWSQPSLI